MAFNRHATTATQSVVIVLGMHRSGTSALTGALEEAGLYLGEVRTYSADNVKGSRELRAIQVLHEDIFSRAGGSWRHPTVNINWFPVHKTLRDTIVQGFKNQPIWGFKDPRTLFMLAGWLELFLDAILVGTFRHPCLVAASLKKRNNIPYAQGLLLWIQYNSALLATLDDHKGMSLIEFDPSSSRYINGLENIFRTLGLEKDGKVFIDSALNNTELPDLTGVQHYERSLTIYNTLKVIEKTRSEEKLVA